MTPFDTHWLWSRSHDSMLMKCHLKYNILDMLDVWANVPVVRFPVRLQGHKQTAKHGSFNPNDMFQFLQREFSRLYTILFFHKLCTLLK